MPSPEQVRTKQNYFVTLVVYAEFCAYQEESKCSPWIPDILGVYREGVCEGGILLWLYMGEVCAVRTTLSHHGQQFTAVKATVGGVRTSGNP